MGKIGLLPQVEGRMTGTLASHIVQCQLLIAEELEKANPDNTLIAVLCNSIRLAKEYAATAVAQK